MKKAESILKEYVRRLNDDTLRVLYSRLSQSMCGDVAEAAEVLSQDRTIDNWLSTASSAADWYSMLDLIEEYVRKEHSRRSGDKVEQLA